MSKKYDSLVFEGGAVLGLAYVSALEEAERLKLISFPNLATKEKTPESVLEHDDPDLTRLSHKSLSTSSSTTNDRFKENAEKPIEGAVYRFAGTSIGAAFAALLACGATPAFLRSEFANWSPMDVARDSLTQSNWYSETNCLMRWFQVPLYLLRDAMQFYKTGGLLRGDKLERQFADLVEKQTGDRNITLLTVHQRYQTDLKIVAVDINRHCISVLSFRNEPNMPMVKAVMASMAVPVLFPWVIHGSSAFVDGGVLCNFFIDAFDERDAETGERDTEHIYPGTLGFKLVTKKESVDLQKAPLSSAANVFESIPRIFSSIMDALHREHQSAVDYDRTVRINVQNMHSFDFDMTEEKRLKMNQYGIEAVQKFCGIFEK